MRLPSLALCAVMACGSSADDWFPADLNKSDVIATAGVAAAAKACTAFEDYLIAQYRDSLLVQVACTALGVDASMDAAACGTFVTTCVEQPPPAVEALVGSIIDATGCGGLNFQPSGCGKTLAELAACLDAAERTMRQLRATLTCSLAGQPLPADALTIVTPPECEAIEVACP